MVLRCHFVGCIALTNLLKRPTPKFVFSVLRRPAKPAEETENDIALGFVGSEIFTAYSSPVELDTILKSRDSCPSPDVYARLLSGRTSCLSEITQVEEMDIGDEPVYNVPFGGKDFGEDTGSMFSGYGCIPSGRIRIPEITEAEEKDKDVPYNVPFGGESDDTGSMFSGYGFIPSGRIRIPETTDAEEKGNEGIYNVAFGGKDFGEDTDSMYMFSGYGFVPSGRIRISETSEAEENENKGNYNASLGGEGSAEDTASMFSGCGLIPSGRVQVSETTEADEIANEGVNNHPNGSKPDFRDYIRSRFSGNGFFPRGRSQTPESTETGETEYEAVDSWYSEGKPHSGETNDAFSSFGKINIGKVPFAEATKSENPVYGVIYSTALPDDEERWVTPLNVADNVSASPSETELLDSLEVPVNYWKTKHTNC